MAGDRAREKLKVSGVYFIVRGNYMIKVDLLLKLLKHLTLKNVFN